MPGHDIDPCGRLGEVEDVPDCVDDQDGKGNLEACSHGRFRGNPSLRRLTSQLTFETVPPVPESRGNVGT